MGAGPQHAAVNFTQAPYLSYLPANPLAGFSPEPSGAGHTQEEWIAQLTASGIPCGRINSVSQALSDPHTVAREMVRTLHHPTAGDVKTLGIPFRFSDTPASVRRVPPTLGQHTEQVLRDVLKLSDARIAELRTAKVI